MTTLALFVKLSSRMPQLHWTHSVIFSPHIIHSTQIDKCMWCVCVRVCVCFVFSSPGFMLMNVFWLCLVHGWLVTDDGVASCGYQKERVRERGLR